MQLCSKLCRGCRKEVPGPQLLKAATEKAMIFAEKECLDCTKEKMDKLFEQWKATMRKYYRNSYKGIIKSPWHHYKAKNIEN